jgi:hypothetical protein
VEQPPFLLCSPELTPNDFCVFQKMKYALKGTKISGYRKNKCDRGTESYYTTENQRNASNSGNIVWLSA